jgi:hypothetical protein
LKYFFANSLYKVCFSFCHEETIAILHGLDAVSQIFQNHSKQLSDSYFQALVFLHSPLNLFIRFAIAPFRIVYLTYFSHDTLIPLFGRPARSSSNTSYLCPKYDIVSRFARTANSTSFPQRN